MAMEDGGKKTELPKVKPFIEEKPTPATAEPSKSPVIKSKGETHLEKIDRLEKGWLKEDVPTTAAGRVGKSIAEEEAMEARRKAEKKKRFGAPPEAEMPPSMDESKKRG